MSDDLQWKLRLASDAEAWWFEHATLSPVKRFTKFVREVVLTEVNRPTAIFIDEVESALKLPFTDDFFDVVRALYNQIATQPPKHSLSFVLLGVADPYDLIQDVTRTLFNVGERIHLRELGLPEALPIFARGLKFSAETIIKRIFFWTSGHPYLTQKIAPAIAKTPSNTWIEAAVDETVDRLFLNESAHTQESNVRFVAGRLTHSAKRDALLNFYRQIRRGKTVVYDESSNRQRDLLLSGLVQVSEDGVLVVRNRIYAA